MQAIQPHYKVLYNGKNITSNVSENLIELSYTDKVSGESDEVSIVLEDVDGNWSGGWYPSKGALLTIEIGYQNGQILKPALFQIDQVRLEWGMSGDTVSIDGLGTGITQKLRTNNSHAHENKTLREIIAAVASKNGYQVIGNIENIHLGRVTQHREKDITFLHRLANEYGYAFSIKGQKMVFYSVYELEGRKHILTIDKSETLGGEITDKSAETYSSASVSCHNPNKNKTIKGVSNDPDVKNGEVLQVRGKTETEQQANAKAKAALHKKNSLQNTGTVNVDGNPLLVAGVNIELSGFGANSGIWHILKSVHRVTKSEGYTTSIEVKRVIPAIKSGTPTKPKKKVKDSRPGDYSVIKPKQAGWVPQDYFTGKPLL